MGRWVSTPSFVYVTYGRAKGGPMSTLSKQFTATLQTSPSKGGWTYVVMPESAEYFGTRGLA